MGWLEKSIKKQRRFIEDYLGEPMMLIASVCQQNWNNRIKLDNALKHYLINKPEHHCRLLYVIDKSGVQYSSNISDVIIDDAIIGQDLSDRPYLQNIKTGESSGVILSDVYIDKQTRRPCITALYMVRDGGDLLGYVAADFGLKDLPLKNVNEIMTHEWRQIKGDPSIRGTLFQQTRTYSSMDKHIDEVMGVIESLMIEQGIFHAKLHFSSSRATLWPYNDPYRYRLHVLDEIVDPTVCLVYEKTPYPEDAVVPADRVRSVLKAFKLLREVDEVIYLRAASLNVMNGLVGLNFSCDGSHYMSYDEFLEKDIRFWHGACEKKSA
jgi:hypothetical protein